MKKLYLTLILLFGFLAFAPQVALADRVIPRRDNIDVGNVPAGNPNDKDIKKKIDIGNIFKMILFASGVSVIVAVSTKKIRKNL